MTRLLFVALTISLVHHSVASQVREDSVRFVVGTDTLSGTLALPERPGPHPAVVLLSGMLQDTRDAPSGGFRTFKVLSDSLAALGIAVLRYDDRGVGLSQGRNTWEWGLEDHAAEAVAALEWLRRRPDIDRDRVGLLGHSYGGPMSAAAARRGASPSFVILASPHVVVDRDIIVGMARRRELATGRSSAEADDEAAFVRDVVGNAVVTGTGWETVRDSMRSRVRERYAQLPDSVRARRTLEAQFNGTMYPLLLRIGPTTLSQQFWNLDLVPYYRALTVPVLALFGAADGQVIADENLALLRGSLLAGGRAPLTAWTVPRANHYLRLPNSSPTEFAPGVIDTIGAWLRRERILR